LSGARFGYPWGLLARDARQRAEAEGIMKREEALWGSESTLRRLEHAVRTQWTRGQVLRFLPMQELGAHASIQAGGVDLLDRLRAAAPPTGKARIDFLAGAACVFADAFLAIFSGSVPRPDQRGAAAYWVILYDDRFVTRSQLEAMLARAAEGVRQGTNLN
jgi:hypothetical protein